MPLTDPNPDMESVTSPRLKIQTMVKDNKTQFRKILDDFTHHPNREEIGVCDVISHRLSLLELDWTIVQGKLEKEVAHMPAETRGARLISDNIVKKDDENEDGAEGGERKDVKDKEGEKLLSPTRRLKRALSGLFSPSKENLAESTPKEGRSLKHKISKHFVRRGSSSKPDNKGKEVEVKEIKKERLWIDEIFDDIAEGLRRVQEQKEIMERFKKERETRGE
jgi:hypothetical protein